MLTAIHRVHLKNGPWLTNGGYEYNIVLIAAVLALAELGPGPLSLDAALGKERAGGHWALTALMLGAAGALGAHLLAEATPAPPQPASPQEASGEEAGATPQPAAAQ